MRDLLFLAHRIPYPPTKGDKLRAWHFLRHFAKSRRVHLGCFIDDDRDWAHVPVLKDLAADTCFVPLRRSRALARSLPALLSERPMTLPYYYDAGLAQWTDRLQRDQSMTVFVYSSSMAQYAMGQPRSTRIIDFVDVDSQKWCDYADRERWPVATMYRREGKALLEAERRIAREFDASVFVSDAEAELFRQLAPECRDRIRTVSNGVDWHHFSPGVDYPDPYAGAGSSVLCFTGMMDYWPNVDAVTWFATTLFARLRHTMPSATFWIVGANPSRRVQKLAELPGVVVTGRVPDVRPYLARAGAVVAPLRIARGIQNKVLEAMAMGRPVVASEQAYEGLRAQPGRDLIVARDADDFVRGVEQIWAGRHGDLGARARQAVQRDYDWSRQLESLDQLVASVEREVSHGERFPPRASVAV